MSGMTGIFNLDGRPVALDDLSAMAEPMRHRGLDGQSRWIDGSAGLGHLMLHTTTESLTETLPYRDPASSLVITADARLDNRSELINKLQLEPGLARTLADSQLLLAAFKRWGDSCVEHLLGDFAFAIWDPHAQRLFCARDHMGKRPFYFYSSEFVFAFGSTVLSVANAPRVPRVINQARVADFLVSELEGINNTTSFVKNVYRLPPAHLGFLQNGKFQQRRYWQLDPEREVRLNSDADYVDALEEMLTHAVSACMRSHLPVAGMLSGGVDSSTICALAGKLSRDNRPAEFVTLSGVSDDDPQCIETSYIRKMQNQLGLRSISLNPSDSREFLDELIRVEGIAEDPFDLGWTMHQMIYLYTRQHFGNVVLDGLDGDGVAGISTMYPSCLIRSGQFSTALQEIRGMSRHYYCGRISIPRLALQVIRPVLTPDFLRRWKHRWWVGSRFDPIIKDAQLSRAFVQKTRLPERVREYRGQSGISFKTDLRALHIDRLEVPYLTAGIERYNRLAASCGVEARAPLLDKRVVEFCVAMPWQQMWRGGQSKYALRSVLQRHVDHEIAWRTGWEAINWKFRDNRLGKTLPEDQRYLQQNFPLIDSLGLLQTGFRRRRQQTPQNFPETERFAGLLGLLRWSDKCELSWN
jgi:asparagine synthase (glutamine-hydrolysing)